MNSSIEELVAAVDALFAHCAMVHKVWGDGCNARQAEEAINATREALAKVKAETIAA